MNKQTWGLFYKLLAGLASLGDVQVFSNEGEVVMVVRDHHGYDAIRVKPDSVVIEANWNSSYWDAWMASHRGVKYIGTLDEHRRPPRWARDFLESLPDLPSSSEEEEEVEV